MILDGIIMMGVVEVYQCSVKDFGVTFEEQ